MEKEAETVEADLIGEPGAWKCKAVELQMEKFTQQNRRRARRLENMKRHNQQQAQKQRRIEKSWNDRRKRRESSRFKAEHKRSMEKKQREDMRTKHKQEKSALGKEINESKIAFVENQRKIQEFRDEKLREFKQKNRQFKALRAREKQEKRQKRLKNVRLAEEKKQADLRKRWEAKDQRTGQFLVQEKERRTVAKVARELLIETKRKRALKIRKETHDQRRKKTAEKIERIYKKAELLDDIDYATNEELKEIKRLQWIQKQSMIKPKEESPGPGAYFTGGSPVIFKHRESDKIEAGPGIRKKHGMANFPSLSEARNRLKALISPIILKSAGDWNLKTNGLRRSRTPRAKLPEVSPKGARASPKAAKAALPNVSKLTSFK